MNRIYSLIFNRALRQLQVASEHAGRRRGGTVRRAAPPRAALAVTALSIGLALGVAPASAQVAPGQLPTGVISISGIGEISAFDDTMTISQVNRRAMIAWETFHVGRDARVVFDQLAGDIVLNRILDPDASQVLGRIDAPGTVFLINPNGIIFGEDAYINVGGLVASTLDMNASDFLGGGSFFYMTGSDEPAPIINQGDIVAGAGGVTMMAGHVGNFGLIKAELGSINLYGTETATLSLGAGGRVSVSLGTPVGDLVPGASAVVENAGVLEAGATVLMHAYTAADFAGTAVNTSGVIRATAINDVAGQVQLRSAGGGNVAVAGPIESAGQLAVDGQSISLDGNITSGGSQSYGGPVVLPGLATLNSDFNINFASSVNGGWLTANAHQGTVTFGGALGNTTPLGGLNVEAGHLLAWSRLNVGGSLALDISQGGIAQSARWSVGGNASIAATNGNITLTTVGNDFAGRVSLYGAAVSIRDSNALQLDELSVTSLSATASGTLDLGSGSIDGDLVATSNNGAIVQSGALEITGTSTLDAGTGSITLARENNRFGDAVTATGNGITLVGRDDLAIAGLTFQPGPGHAVHLEAGGTLRLPGAIDTGPADLILASNGGQLATAGMLAGASVKLTGADGIILGHDLSGESVALHSGANISQLDGVLDAGRLGVQTEGSAWLVAENQVGELGNVNVEGHFSLRNVPAITQLSGTRVSVGGHASFSSEADITLKDPAGHVLNRVGGEVSLTGGNVEISVDNDGLRLGQLDVASLVAHSEGTLNLGYGEIRGDLQATGNEDIRQSGALAVHGTSTLNAGGVIFLENDGNRFDGTVHLAGETTRIAASGALQLGDLDVDALRATSVGDLDLGQGQIRGSLEATSGDGDISQSGALAVGHTTALDAGGGNITLADANNDFTGAVHAAGAGVAITDRNVLTVGTVTGTADVRLQGGSGMTISNSVSGNRIDLATTGPFVNYRGASALVAADSWRVYLASPEDAHDFGGLNSENTAIWNTSAFAPVAPGNRYVFAYQPTLTFSSVDVSKTYGQAIDLTGAYAVSGLMDGVAGAYLGDTLANVVTGTPILSSAGAGASATVAGGPYGIDISAGSVDVSDSGYGFRFENTGLLTIDRAALILTASDATKTYGEAGALAGFAVEGLLNNDVVTGVDLATGGSVATATVGDYVISIDNASGSGLDNYDITYVDGVLTVGKAGLVIRANDAGKTYGQTGVLAGYSVEGLVNDDAVTGADLASGGTAATATVGDYVITVDDATGSGLGNYDITYVDGVLTVAKAGLVIRANDAGKTYGQAGGLAGYSVEGLVNDDAVTGANLASGGTATTATVGDYVITVDDATGSGLGNYDITYVDGILTVGKAGLVIRANDAGKTYGQTGGLAGYSVEGLVNDDTVTGTNLASGGTAATATVGDYAITVDDATGSGLENYDISYVDGVLTVGKAGLVIRANNAGKTYGQTGGLAGYTVEGLVNDDAVTGAALASGGSAATATVGDYVISVDNASGNGLQNYDITYVDGVLTVGKAGLVIRASDAFKTMGEEIGLEDYTVAGLVNGDRVTAVNLSSPGSAATATPGGYAIVADNAVGSGLDNYEIQYVEGTLQVGVDPVPVTQAVSASLAPAPGNVPPAADHAAGFRIEGDGLLMPPEAACRTLMPGPADCPPHSPR